MITQTNKKIKEDFHRMSAVILNLDNEADCKTARAVKAFEQMDISAQDKILDFLRELVNSRETAS